MMFPNADRVRSIVSEAKTEQDVTILLRLHKIKYHYATDTGFLSIRIPCRKGCIRVYRVASRNRPFVVQAET